MTTPRPQAGYMRWLEKQSMLSQAPGYISQVSQTERIWINNSAQERSDILLAEAGAWLNYPPPPGEKHFFRSLEHVLPQIAALGIKGIYLGELGENLDLWLENRPEAQLVMRASFEHDPGLGDEKAFEALRTGFENAGLEMGAALVPAATGRGPDFILQARKAPGHQGLYAMLEISESIASLLPTLQNEWQFAPLDSNQVASMAAAGILPERLLRQQLPWLAEGGWAVTGPVMGLDGQPRRWLYRYDQQPRKPVLLWQDPSGAAKNIYAASIIQHTGLQRQTLAGIGIAPFIGLEPMTGATLSSEAYYAPAIEAINELASQVHRYGGWAMQTDPLAPETINSVLAGPCDFCLDPYSTLLAAYGLAAQDASPLANIYKKWLQQKLPFKRLARGLLKLSEIPADLLKALPDGQSLVEKIFSFANKSSSGRPAKDIYPQKNSDFINSLNLGMPGLAFFDATALSSGSEDFSNWSTRHIPAKLIEARNVNGLAQGSVEKIVNPLPPLLGILSLLPTGNYWLSANNFGRKEANLTIQLPKKATSAIDAENNEDLSACLSPDRLKFRLPLDESQARNVIFYMN